MMHPDDFEIFHEARKLAYRLADLIDEKLNTFEAKRRPSTGTLGLCYVDERRISILFRRKSDGRWWKHPQTRKDVLETVAHEVAHLRHPNHNKEFRKLEKQLIEAI